MVHPLLLFTLVGCDPAERAIGWNLGGSRDLPAGSPGLCALNCAPCRTVRGAALVPVSVVYF